MNYSHVLKYTWKVQYVLYTLQTADQACQVAQGEGTVGQGGSGPRTIEYLCSTGALHLEKSDFASASTVSRILIRLGGCDSWKEAVAAQLKSCLEKKPQVGGMCVWDILYCTVCVHVLYCTVRT